MFTLTNFDNLKLYRAFRVEIKPSDRVGFSVEFENADYNKEGMAYIGKPELIDLSLTGLAFKASQRVAEGEKVEVKVRLKNETFTFKSLVVRSGRFEEGYIHGILFADDNEYAQTKRLLETYVKFFRPKRIRKELEKLFLDQKWGGRVSDGDIAPLYSNIMYKLSNLSNVEDFIFGFTQELKYLVGAEKVSLYECIDSSHVKIANTDSFEGNIFSVEDSVLSSIKKSFAPVNYRFFEDKKDPFYLQMEKLIGDDVKTVLVVPIIDSLGNIIGFIDAINKTNGELFDNRDENYLKLFGLFYQIFLERKKKSEYQNAVQILEDDKRREYALIGGSDTTSLMRQFLIDNLDKTRNIMIFGEYGTGKFHLAQTIQSEETCSKQTVGHINCDEFFDESQIRQYFMGDEGHLSRLNIYSGGTLVLRNLCSLDYDLQKCLFECIKNNKDIRFISTYSHKKDSLYLPLYEFLSLDEIQLKSLNDREEDIIPLAKYFLKKIVNELGITSKEISKELTNYLLKKDWKYNISELYLEVETLIFNQRNSRVLEPKNEPTSPNLLKVQENKAA